MTHQRFDTSRGRLAKAKKTPQGFARVDARLTRTGILEYVRADGSMQREYRPDSEVFCADSLATLDNAPVTDLHPSAMIDPSNARHFSRGNTRGARRDGKFVAAELTVQDAELISKIDAGERTEISCGYTCDLDYTPGVYEGQRYDAVQRKIVYNHVAIGPRNWGRAGADVALRLDAADAHVDSLVSRFDSEDETARARAEMIARHRSMAATQPAKKVDAAAPTAPQRNDAAQARAEMIKRNRAMGTR
jgi:hypothetical protein